MSVSQSFSVGASFSAVDGLPETEKTAGESENTYILRPIFQQRRVANGMLRGRPLRRLPPTGRARLVAWALGRGWGGGGAGLEGGEIGRAHV